MKTSIHFFLIVLNLLFSIQLKAQKRDTSIYKVLGKNGDSLEVYEVNPQFPGGTQELFKFLANNIRYPANAKKNGAKGIVYISFKVDIDGSIKNVMSKKIDKYCFSTPKERKKEEKLPDTVYQELIDECIRLIKSMPKWLPGVQQGKPVGVVFTLPIKFKLD